ncbi:hypothetical protein [Streptomyces sp. NPDC004589]|uniref:hypothetical protein n=1 Tax=Streptomyces sp. NPDC004589 TaxID=3154553 RepID=UPI0033BC8ADE
MSTLMRAPQPCASWEWELDGFAPPGLESALMTAARMTVVLREHGLLEPSKLEWIVAPPRAWQPRGGHERRPEGQPQ